MDRLFLLRQAAAAALSVAFVLGVVQAQDGPPPPPPIIVGIPGYGTGIQAQTQFNVVTKFPQPPPPGSMIVVTIYLNQPPAPNGTGVQAGQTTPVATNQPPAPPAPPANPDPPADPAPPKKAPPKKGRPRPDPTPPANPQPPPAPTPPQVINIQAPQVNSPTNYTVVTTIYMPNPTGPDIPVSSTSTQIIVYPTPGTPPGTTSPGTGTGTGAGPGTGVSPR